MKGPSLRRRMVGLIVAAVIATAALFGLATFVFAYTIEDELLANDVAAEVARQQAGWATTGVLPPSQRPFITIHRSAASLPADLRGVLSPAQREYFGSEGRHYHVQRFQLPARPGHSGGPALAVAEVSGQLVVRRYRDELILFLAGLAAVLALVMGVIGALATRRAMAPLTRLARDIDAAGDGLPVVRAADYPAGEIGVLAGALEAGLARVGRFVERERAFTRDASHELRTPIAVVRGAAEVLALQQPAHPALARIETAATDMTQTLDLLLALAREGETPAGKAAGVRALVERALADAALRWPGSRVEPVVALSADLVAPVHAATLQLVLNNLIGNAFQHSGGARIMISGDAGGLVIMDDGPGIDNVPAALLPFHKGENSAGSGLGLAIVARLCASAGIDLAIGAAGPDGGPGRGTRLALRWPDQPGNWQA
jgi:signal transduction histidine kinase